MDYWKAGILSIRSFLLFLPSLPLVHPSCPLLTQMPPRGVFIAEAVSIKSIYRLYSCSLPGTFSNGTLGTGSCESCRPDSHPAWTHTHTHTEKKELNCFNLLVYFTRLERQFSACYPAGRSVSRWKIVLLSRSDRPVPPQLQSSLIPVHKCSIPLAAAKIRAFKHIRLDYTCSITAAVFSPALN